MKQTKYGRCEQHDGSAMLKNGRCREAKRVWGEDYYEFAPCSPIVGSKRPNKESK